MSESIDSERHPERQEVRAAAGAAAADVLSCAELSRDKTITEGFSHARENHRLWHHLHINRTFDLMRSLALLPILLAAGIPLFAQVARGDLASLATMERGERSKRVSSYDRTGSNGDALTGIKPGDKVDMLQLSGVGIITHIWITFAPGADKLNRHDIILRMYWDGNSYPSVEAPLDAFFGNGWGENYNFISAPLSVSPGWGRSYVSYFPMPFASGARIELENQNDSQAIESLYFNIDYSEMKTLPPDVGRFHAWFNHEITDADPAGENEWGSLGPTQPNTDPKRNYLIADIKGRGRFVGVNYYVNCPSTMWYGEGDEMIYLDGDEQAPLTGTGTEDYFNTSWCPKETFQHPYFGYPRVNGETGWLGRTHAYRFHIVDPITFESSCRFTIEHGHNNVLTLELASVAYWYQELASQLPKSPTKMERKPMPIIAPVDIHKWRDAWRRERGGGSKLWGNEPAK